MLKKSIATCSLALLLLLTSSCFDVLEEVNLNKDGSGSMVLTVNMSKSKTKLASIMLLDSVNGYKIPSRDDIDLALNDAVAHLKKSNGISNIKTTKDFDNYIFSISCDFKDIESLNGITAELISKQNQKGKTKFNTKNFGYLPNSKIFERRFTYDPSIKKSFDYLENENKKVFEDAGFIAIYRFNDQKVQSVSNTLSRVAPSKKAVMLKIDAMSFIKGEKTIQNTIQLSN